MLGAFWRWITSSDSRPYINDSYTQLSSRLEKALLAKDVLVVSGCLFEISKRVRSQGRYAEIVQRAQRFIDSLDDTTDIESNQSDSKTDTEQCNARTSDIDTLVEDKWCNEPVVKSLNNNITLAKAARDSTKLPPEESTSLESCNVLGTEDSVGPKHEKSSDELIKSVETCPAEVIRIADDSRDMLVERLPLAQRIRSRLKRLEIYYLRELNGLSKAEIMTRRGINAEMFDELMKWLHEHGHIKGNSYSCQEEGDAVQLCLTDETDASHQDKRSIDNSKDITTISDLCRAADTHYQLADSRNHISTDRQESENSFEDDVLRKLGEFF